MTIPDGDFTVGAQVDQRHQILGAGHADGNNPSQNIRSHKTAQAALKANAAVLGQRPAQILRLKMLRTLMRGLERHMRKRLDIEPGKQMMHHRVADQHYLGNLLFAACSKLRNHLPKCKTHRGGQIGSGQRCLDSLHHVRAERCLRIEIGLDRENAARGHVDHLCGDGRRTQIDGNPQAGLPRPRQTGVVRQHIHMPLAALENQRHLRPRLAGEPPSISKLLR